MTKDEVRIMRLRAEVLVTVIQGIFGKCAIR